jgi:hypothetical protein
MRLSTTSILEPYSFAHPSQIVTAIIVMIRLFSTYSIANCAARMKFLPTHSFEMRCDMIEAVKLILLYGGEA